MRLLELLPDDILGKYRGASGSNDPADAAAFEVIASHEGFKRVIGEAA